VKLGIDTIRKFLGWSGIVTLSVTSLSTILLAVGLFLKVREPRPVVLVPGLDRPRVVLPGQVPDTLARDFAVDFAVAFENYSPATVEGGTKFLKGRIAPPTFQQFSQVLDKRMKLVSETGMVSQLLVPDRASAQIKREGEQMEVIFPAVRRVYVGDRLSQEGRVAYRIVLVPQEPTRENPTGLYVLGQSAKVENAKGAGDAARK
jgi:hypothetical protein